MKKNSIFLFLSLAITTLSYGQKVAGLLKFKKGQSLEVNMNVKTVMSQQVSGQAIDLSMDGSVTHLYKVTNATNENTTLHHQVKKITFSFDGMGQKKKFNSDDPKDLEGQLGKLMKEALNKSFDMVIDPNGKVLKCIPEKFDTSDTDSRLLMITNMLKDVLGSVEPPQKDQPSFFKILPGEETSVGETWSDSVNTESEKSATVYTIAAINDTTIVVNFATNSTTNAKAEMMGIETTTSMNNKTSGKIILDKRTRIIRQKNSTTESNGTTESPFGNLPIISKIVTSITVKPGK
ncbi:MAG TPA: DUF6263 family protein [Chitinophagaceae bacterium]|nr:DUF6263 family protein [Chitinophagaceae bacterium]